MSFLDLLKPRASSEHSPPSPERGAVSRLISDRRVQVGSALLAAGAIFLGSRFLGDAKSPEVDRSVASAPKIDEDLIVEGVTIIHEGMGPESDVPGESPEELLMNVLLSLEKIGLHPPYRIAGVKALIREYEREKDPKRLKEIIDEIMKRLDEMLDEVRQRLDQEEEQRLREMLRRVVA